jgi:tRNA-dihydrouridine synthase B
MFLKPLKIKNLVIDPPLFCAPMAGITHSAFRRLASDFGSYGALFTEMLSGRALLHERIGGTPFTKKRACEGVVWYQLALNGEEDIPVIIDRLKTITPAAIDINAACPAPEILPQGLGAALFRDLNRFTKTISSVRRCWDGPLTVKCRLGDESPHWRESLKERFKIMEAEGVDGVILHPRFFSEKLKRKARWELFDWATSETSLPVIANGDMVSVKQIEDSRSMLSSVAGLMVGRMSIVKPWIFSEIAGKPVAVDFVSVWSSLYDYILEDFSREKALGRIKEYSKYFAQNFLFGHEMYRKIQTACSLEILRENAMRFLESDPKTTGYPTVLGL